MIGFRRFEGEAAAEQQEGEDTRHLSKHKLYNMLSENWFLPSVDSKGVCRQYLLRVHRNEVFRVTNREYKTFEVNVNPAHFKKNGLTCLGHLVNRLNRLLTSRNERVLGFPPHVIPEESWLIKVARKIDQHNLLEFFQREVTPLTIVHDNSPIINRLYVAKIQLFRHLFLIPQHMRNQQVFQATTAISENQRKLNAKLLEVGQLEAALVRAREDVTSFQALVRDSILKAATLVYSRENQNFLPEHLLAADNAANQAHRARLEILAHA